MEKIFHDFDFTDFWDDDEYALAEYVEEPPTDELIESIETEIGFKLPVSYIELMKMHNGGIPKKTCYPVNEATSEAGAYIAISGLMAIGREKIFSIAGKLGSPFMISEGGYPDTGVCICTCPSAGHDMVMLDYSNCGKNGEPEVVHIDQESDYKKTFLAKDFETFIRGLVSEEVYDTSEQDPAHTLESFKTGRFSDVLERYFRKEKNIDFDKVLRNLLTELTREKGYFALHDDELSWLAYDIQFYLLTLNKSIRTRNEFVKCYPEMVAMGNNEISTRGYASFFEDWFDARLRNKEITNSLFTGLHFTKEYREQLFEKVKRYG